MMMMMMMMMMTDLMTCLRCVGENYVASDDLVEALLAYNVAMADVASGDSHNESYWNKQREQQQQQQQQQQQKQRQQQHKDMKQAETNVDSVSRVQQHRYCVVGDVVDAATTPASAPSPVTARRKQCKNNSSSGIGSSNRVCIEFTVR